MFPASILTKQITNPIVPILYKLSNMVNLLTVSDISFILVPLDIRAINPQIIKTTAHNQH